ncbi:MAG TPA: hypothetical protein VGY77_00340 [Gemmataceae bacterium]|jgi:hypothetical protein|nr:hypothetical protein [Gemmataceae bacterium]
MFATLTLERDPLKFEQIPADIQSWLLAAGGFSAAGILLWLLLQLGHREGSGPIAGGHSWIKILLAIILGGYVVSILPAGIALVGYDLGWGDPAIGAGKTIGGLAKGDRLKFVLTVDLLKYGAGCALVAALLPVLFHLGRLSPRRIWALTKLSFKEAVRRRILWVFSLLVLVFLFASWFLPYKSEDQLRNYVRTVYFVMTLLLLVTAGLLASFSLPADLRNQTIHTIVTKPVERFEIILGRFLGYTFLLTLVLIVMNLFCLVYVARGINQEAAEESYKARVPIYGNLDVKGAKNVGYEWDYRKYISGDAKKDDPEYAVWTFTDLPRDLANRGRKDNSRPGEETIPVEITFDIFRTTKGEENKGIYCSFMFENFQCAKGNVEGVPLKLEQYRQELESLRQGGLARKAIDNQLAEKYGYHEVLSFEVTDFHTLGMEIPAALFKNLNEWDRSKDPPFRVTVKCDSRTQYLGIAKYDFYLMDDVRSFEVNFFKGGVGLWYRLCLVIGVAVTCSTYLSGVISFLATMFLYLAGLLLEFIQQVAAHQAIGGGPFEALFRLVRKEHITIPLDQNPNPLITVIQNTDKISEWILGLFLNLIPNIDRYDLTDFVAEGFDVSWQQLLLTGLLLLGYLLPWAVLSFYLMRSREVAA